MMHPSPATAVPISAPPAAADAAADDAADDADVDVDVDADAVTVDPGPLPPPGPDRIRRALSSIIADELRFQRGEDLGSTCGGWDADVRLDGPEIRADSLEIIGLAARANQAFHLHESGHDEGLRTAPRLGDWATAIAASLARPGARMTFLTSGSTGEPRTCTHALAALLREVDSLATHFAGRRRIVATVPAHHIYGFLFTVLLPGALGVPVLDVRGATGSEVRRRLRPGDLVVSHPLGWDDLGTAAGDPPPPEVRGVSSTAPCPPAVIERARAAGFAAITEVYGSSETAGIGFRDDPAAPYTLMPHVDRQIVAVSAMDQLEWIDARHFRVGPRLDHVVQVGGINVHPDHVARTLREHPGVADAAVRLMRADEGRRLKAFVVPKVAAEADAEAGPGNGDEELRRSLDAWCAERLDAPARPRAMRFGPALPRTDTGKAADWDAFEAAPDLDLDRDREAA
jgi:4-coumarate--CoA ligase